MKIIGLSSWNHELMLVRPLVKLISTGQPFSSIIKLLSSAHPRTKKLQSCHERLIPRLLDKLT